jgi:hypothetical protein
MNQMIFGDYTRKWDCYAPYNEGRQTSLERNAVTTPYTACDEIHAT